MKLEASPLLSAAPLRLAPQAGCCWPNDSTDVLPSEHLSQHIHLINAPLNDLQEGNNGSEPTPGGLARGLTLEKLLSRGDAELVAILGSTSADNMLNLSNTFGSGDLDHLVGGRQQAVWGCLPAMACLRMSTREAA
jgi:hypothetical protein